MIDAEALHRAAARVGSEYGMPEMDALARAGGDFIQSSTFTDTQALGYGIMLGYLAALEELE
jgi:hypothetical protein